MLLPFGPRSRRRGCSWLRYILFSVRVFGMCPYGRDASIMTNVFHGHGTWKQVRQQMRCDAMRCDAMRCDTMIHNMKVQKIFKQFTSQGREKAERGVILG
ncbi:hypothetical protein L226DRAFT_108964 [Lentinus tigrinus ALCF2SS1-7]|uniref:uncharacterized protein n=1 Tax=Lentinus tigrinus ALCF2SS1-7 TaxID=1328758 RepID=UPI001165E6B3|nr:hypothetical protein L226DRAFT_108964 [Lentinus tigrinus ALCF2SS1-7]